MPFELPGLTVRQTMMVLTWVALIIGVPIQLLRMNYRSDDYAFSGAMHAARERNAREAAQQSEEEWRAKYNETRAALASGRITSNFHGPEHYFSPPPDFQRKLADYHRRLKEKYEWAADHPWQTPSPDPPKPQWDWDREP